MSDSTIAVDGGDVEEIEDRSQEGGLQGLNSPRRISSEFVTLSDFHGRKHDHTPRRESYISYDDDEDEDSYEDTIYRQDYDFRLPKLGRDSSSAILHGRGLARTSTRSKPIRTDKGDLELWWVDSPTWRRTIPLMCVLMLLMTIVNSAVSILYFTAERYGNDGKDFEVCKTQGCVDLSDWISQSLDTRIDPCQNFYLFVCNNLRADKREDRNPPREIEFKFAKLEFNDRSSIDSVLKRKFDPKNIIIPFYKSCIDKAFTVKNDLNTLVNIINLTMPYLFKDVINFDRAQGVFDVISLVGHNGIMGFQLFEYPFLALLPPPKWIRDFSQVFALENGFQNYRQHLLETYRILWKRFEDLIGKPVLEYELATNYTIELLRIFSALKYDHKNSATSAQLKFKSSRFIGHIFGESWTPQVLNISGSIFTDGDLDYTIGQYVKRFPDDSARGPAVVSYWIFLILEFFHWELDADVYRELKLDSIFTELTHLRRIQSIERFCFEAVTRYVPGYTFSQFEKHLDDSDLLTRKTEETFGMIRRVLRDAYYRGNFEQNLSPLESYILTRFVHPGNRVVISYPFPHDEKSRKILTDLETYQSGLKPGRNYLMNLRDATIKLTLGRIDAWKAGRLVHRLRQNFRLEALTQYTDNGFTYENNLFPPIVLFDPPLFLNDMKVFDNAGAVLFLAESLLALVDLNIANPGPLSNLIQPEALTRAQSLTNPMLRRCSSDDKVITTLSFLRTQTAVHVLAMKLVQGLHFYENRFRTPSFVQNGSIAEGVEILYYPDGSTKYVRIEEDTNGRIQLVDLDDADYFINDPDKFKFKYKRAPNSLENFTEQQLFFLAAIRHHCFQPNTTDPRHLNYAKSVNLVLQHLSEFAKAWNCPIGPMNPPNKCVDN